MKFTLNKREFRGVIKLRYYWEFILTMCVCGDLFDADYAMICIRGGYIIRRHNEIWNLQAKTLQAVCTEVEIQPVLQGGTGEVLPMGTNRAPDARLDIRSRASGRENSRRSLMFGYATLTLTQTRISTRSRFTSYTRMRKSAFTLIEFLW